MSEFKKETKDYTAHCNHCNHEWVVKGWLAGINKTSIVADSSDCPKCGSNRTKLILDKTK